MPRIALLTPSLAPGDAITNDILGMLDSLERHGYEAGLYAAASPFDKPAARPVSKINSFLKRPEDVLLYHYSMGWEPALELLLQKKCKRVVKYHNVTPAHFFEGWSNEYELACETGREQLRRVAESDCELYLSDSAYNREELVACGAPAAKSFVLPPFHHIDRLSATDADLNVLDAYRDEKANILMVGRVAPNKGHRALIDAFAIYHHYYNNRSRLLIVGKEDRRLESYSASLREQVARLRLQEAVVFTGEVSDEQLKAYYLLSHIFMMTSEHEGFCVPLVEAMAMKLPVVAYATSAIPLTVNGAGLVWNERDPHLLAESINFIIRDESIAARLGLMGRRRYEHHFTNEKIEAEFLKALSELL